MRVLAAAGAGALILTMPLTIAIVVVLAIVVISYQQTIRAYPNGGGSYIVASDNLGRGPGLVAAGALLTDYVLTVAVSIAAGVAALTSIFPGLFDFRVVIGLVFVAVLWLGNLRGIRESATIFAVPTYVYLVAIYGLLAFGMWQLASGTLPEYTPPPGWLEGHDIGQTLGILLILRAFAAGSVALTGTEAVSNGVPAFRPPEPRNAGTVLILMGVFFGSIFLGISLLASQMGVVPDPTEQETVISQVTRTLVGAGTPFHYLVQISTALLLVLAANTAFADFPRLASILGKDRYLPRQFQFRGDRLAFSIGIMVLAILAGVLIVAFQGSVTNLIPLYTVGVFVAFTLSQSGMVVHWWRLRNEQRGWRWRAALNGAGAVATGAVALIVGVAKFALGAWMILLLIPLLVGVMWAITAPLPQRRGRARRRLDRPADARPNAAGHRADQPPRPRGLRRDRLRPRHLGRRPSRPRRRRPGIGRRDAAPVARMGRTREARHPRIAVPRAHGAAARVHRRDRRQGSEPADDRGARGVRPPPLVGVPTPQPDRAAAEVPALLPPEHRRHRRAVPLEAHAGVGPLRERSATLRAPWDCSSIWRSSCSPRS